MGSVVAIAANSFRRLLGTARFYVALVITFCSVIVSLNGVPAFLDAQGFSVQAGELFILMISNRIPQLLLIFSFLLLLGDAPFFHEGMDVVFIRSNKTRWIMAQILMLVVTTALWLLFLLLSINVFFAGRTSFGNTWSEFLTIAARLWRGSAAVGLNMSIGASINLFALHTPYQMLGIAFLYGFLLFSYFGVWGMFLNLWTKRSYGSILIVAFFALRYTLHNLNRLPFLYRISPMNLVDLCTVKADGATIGYTVLFFLLQSVLLGILSRYKLKRQDVSRLG